MNSQRAGWKWILGIVAVVTIAVSVFFGVSSFLKTLAKAYFTGDTVPISERRFDAEEWLENKPLGDGYSARSEMIADLLARFDFGGWPAENIVALLGPPETPNVTGAELTYLVGRDRAGGAEFEWLLFELDEHGNVEESWLFID
jgi:hypothetical protein